MFHLYTKIFPSIDKTLVTNHSCSPSREQSIDLYPQGHLITANYLFVPNSSKIIKACSKRRIYHVPNLIQSIKYMISSTLETIKFDVFN